MKKVIFLTVIAVVMATSIYAQTSIYSVSENGTINFNSELIDTYTDTSLPSNFVDVSSTNIYVSSKDFIIKLKTYDGWQNEVSYNVIEFYSNNVLMLRYKQRSSLTLFYDSRHYYGRDLTTYATNNSFIETSPSSTSKALIFIGWPYGGEKPQLLIFVLTSSDVKLVYNKHMGINSVVNSGNNFSMQIQSNTQETTDGVNWTPAITHTIWAEDGVLKFKDNK